MLNGRFPMFQYRARSGLSFIDEATATLRLALPQPGIKPAFGGLFWYNQPESGFFGRGNG